MRREGALQRSTGKRKADVRVSAKCKAPRVVVSRAAPLLCVTCSGRASPPPDTTLDLHAQGSSFAVCPLCSKSVIKALLDMHVNSCKGAPPSSAPFSVVDAHASGAHLHSEAAVTQPTEGGSQTQAASQPAAPRPAAHKHAGGKADGPGVADPAQDKLQDHKHNLEVRTSASPGAEQPAIVQSAHSRPPAAAQRPPQPTGHSAPREDAFAHLMRQQRERSQTWTFFLGARPDGGLFWHIWRGDKGAGRVSMHCPLIHFAVACPAHVPKILALDRCMQDGCRNKILLLTQLMEGLVGQEARLIRRQESSSCPAHSGQPPPRPRWRRCSARSAPARRQSRPSARWACVLLPIIGFLHFYLDAGAQ